MGIHPSRSVLNAVNIWLREGRRPTGLAALSPASRLKAMLVNDRLRRMVRAARRGR